MKNARMTMLGMMPVVLLAACAAPTETGSAPEAEGSLLDEMTMYINGWSTDARPPYVPTGGAIVHARATFTNVSAGASSTRGGGLCLMQLDASPLTCIRDSDCANDGYCMTQDNSSVAKGCFHSIACNIRNFWTLNQGQSTSVSVAVDSPPDGYYYTLSVLSGSSTPGQCSTHDAQQNPSLCTRSLSDPAYITTY